MFDFIKDLISTRGAQLIARYGAVGLVALATKEGVTLDPAAAGSAAQVIGTMVVAAVLMVIDHYSHAKQADAK